MKNQPRKENGGEDTVMEKAVGWVRKSYYFSDWIVVQYFGCDGLFLSSWHIEQIYDQLQDTTGQLLRQFLVQCIE